jgi:guanylate kinase
VKALLAQNPALAFSISACSRPPRGEEQDGVHYYFLSPESFKEKIAAGAFFEWEEVYTGMFYGTLNAELERIWAAGQIVVFDVDVVGGLRIKELLGELCLLNACESVRLMLKIKFKCVWQKPRKKLIGLLNLMWL